MCNHPKCIYIDIIEMTNGEKLYVHYDNNLVPIMFQFYDEQRNIETEYMKVHKPSLYLEENFEWDDEITIPDVDVIPEIEILPKPKYINFDFIEDLS